MIVKSLCNSCFQTYVLTFQVSDVGLVKQISDEVGHTCPCPRLCGGSINLVGEFQIAEMTEKMRLRDPIRLTGMELFKAVKGLGLPDEIVTSDLTLNALFQSRKVTGLEIEKIDDKLYLHEIVLGNVRVHLAAGQRGAQVLKITVDPNGA
jgi:hypothetical protein